MSKLDKSFEPKNIENRWYSFWEGRGYFAAGLDTSNSDNFCILLPPPNVTGTLHMGHGFNQTIMDALTRYIVCARNTFGSRAPTTLELLPDRGGEAA